MKLQFYFWLFLLPIFLKAQDMQQGFTNLEKGEYQKAIVFFENTLQQYPKNKTAKLCYGRAIGLAGEPQKAIRIFSELLNTYPDDFEIKLNYAESLLWNKRFDQGASYYKQLVGIDATSFSAVLGYANALSNQQQYPEALKQVNRALTIQPENPNALLSRKYIRLGYAFVLSKEKNTTQALSLLDQNLVDFPKDTETLLNKGTVYTNLQAYTKAEESYRTISGSATDSVLALNGLSLVAHKRYKDKKALSIAKVALQKSIQIPEKDTQLLAQERYVQALLWNQKFNDAHHAIEQLQKTFVDHPKVLALKASYGMYTGHFKQSIQTYLNILQKDSTSFDGNLGIANAYRAAKQERSAFGYAQKTLGYFPKQENAAQLINDLKKQFTPFINHKSAYTFDNGKNEAFQTGVQVSLPITAKWILLGNYTYRTTQNTNIAIQAETHDATIGATYQIHPAMRFKTSLGVNNAKAVTNSFTQMIADAKFIITPFRLQNLTIGYQRELQNFNAALIDRELVMNSYQLTYNLGSTFNLGWYTQAMYTNQSDSNTRGLIFTSLYYTWLRRPILKTGLNYQYLGFKDQLPAIYFSPETFHQYEFFAELLPSSQKNWIYHLSAAIGRQFVDQQKGSNTFRTELKLGYHISNRLKSHVYGKYSNIAAATAAGFEFTEIGFVLKWHFLSKPISNKY